MVNRQQMELNLGTIESLRPSLARRQYRKTRAQWWFSRMHQVVDSARDWTTSKPQSQETLWNESSSRQ